MLIVYTGKESLVDDDALSQTNGDKISHEKQAVSLQMESAIDGENTNFLRKENGSLENKQEENTGVLISPTLTEQELKI